MDSHLEARAQEPGKHEFGVGEPVAVDGCEGNAYATIEVNNINVPKAGSSLGHFRRVVIYDTTMLRSMNE